MFKLCIFQNPIDSKCVLTLDNGTIINGIPDTYQNRACQSFPLPDNTPQGNGCSLSITHVGKVLLLQRSILYINKPGFPYPWAPTQTAALAADDFYLQNSSNFPDNPPTRLEVLQVNTHFRGGIIVNSPDYGMMPWWDSALAWCPESTRTRVYIECRDSARNRFADTHKILNIPSGQPLYNSGNNSSNYYNPSRFPALDWTNGMSHLDSRFTDLVDEIVGNGYKVIITMNEEYAYSIQIIRMVMEVLQPRQVPWCLTMPGYDGVFYGWEPSTTLIPGWATAARSIKPNCILGIEFNPAHIPLGGGPADYAIGGIMDGFDCILGEFPTVPPDLTNRDECDNVWQILGRCVKPYHRDPNQPADDDPNPPFYLTPSPRGPRTFVALETWNPYNWVRINPNDINQVMAAQAQIYSERDYFAARGCLYIG